MNNRFKFRVYDPTKKMLIYFELDNIIVPYNLLCQDKYTVQQNTSLIDKNNNPIYEGDIVSFSYRASEHDVEEEIGKVFFSEGIFYFGKSLFASNDSNFITESIEVIGNIFNPPCKLDANGECLICDDIIDNCQFKTK